MSIDKITGLQLAAKSIPTDDIFSILESVGIKAIEVYTDAFQLNRSDFIDVCRDFDLLGVWNNSRQLSKTIK